MRKTLILTLCLVLLMGVVVSAKQLKIGFSTVDLTSAFFQAEGDIIRAMAKAEGAEVIQTVAEGDMSTQRNQIEDMIARGVDVIIARPVDSEAILSSARDARAKGIPFVILGRVPEDVTDIDLGVAVNSSAAAAACIDYIYEEAQKRGIKQVKLIEMQGDLRDQVAVEIAEGVAQRTKELGIELVSQIPTEWNPTLGHQRFSDAAQIVDFNAVFMASDMFLPSVTGILRANNKLYPLSSDEHIILSSMDGMPESIPFIRGEYIGLIMGLSPDELAGAAMIGALDLARGKKLESKVVYAPHTPLRPDNLDELAGVHWSVPAN